ncbi:MAG: hypothetical protein JNM14_07180 [Ferruginibacter sp.]|nr:hypothetical protein [Ferruginibacter sp.]
MKLLITLISVCLFYSPVQAQTSLKKVITLQLPEGDGSNAAAVVWHPVTQKYYTTIVGNAIYAMGIFDARGKVVEQNIEAEHDYRGMWYNPLKKRIEFNCYDSGGIGHLVLDKKGKITAKLIDLPGMNQPGDQSVGVYCAAGNKILYMNPQTHDVDQYDAVTGTSLGNFGTIYPGCKTKKEADEMDVDAESAAWDSRNYTSVQYTGVPKAELAILNVDDKQVELYDRKTGLLTKKLKIPEDVNLYPSFNFSYSNGIYWFFNKEDRKWVGCK